MNPMEAHDGEDAELLAELAQVMAVVDPVPPELVATAEASLILHTIDAVLAELTYDSAVDGGGVLVRGAPIPRLLTFEAPGMTVELATEAVGDGRRVVGQVVPALPGPVEVRHRGGVVPVTADELGRFVVIGIEPGPVSVRCRRSGTPENVVVDTDWFLA